MENSITLFSELRATLGTDSQGSGTECGWVMFNNQNLYVLRHWSYSGGYPVYFDEACLYPLGEFESPEDDKEWFPVVVDGVAQKCKHGIYPLYDCKILLKEQNTSLNLFINKYWDDQAIIFSQPTEITDKRLLMLLEEENVVNPFETLYFLREYAYNYKCMICAKNLNS